jgi:hypothetical protein
MEVLDATGVADPLNMEALDATEIIQAFEIKRFSPKSPALSSYPLLQAAKTKNPYPPLATLAAPRASRGLKGVRFAHNLPLGLRPNPHRSYWILGSFETSSSMSAPSNALPRFRTL